MTNDILAELTEIVGERRIVTGPQVAEREFPWETHASCDAKAIVMPESTEEVAAIVPFGGMTNLVQGCATTAADIVLSLERLDRIEDIDRSARVPTAKSEVWLR